MDRAALSRAVEAAGTPLFVYDGTALRARAAALRAALPAPTELYYSLKANPNLHLSRLLADAGFGLEVCSPAELATALRTGADPARMLYVGPAKRAEDCAACVAAGLGLVAAESLQDLEQLQDAARDAARVQGVILRINPASPGQGKLVMSGRATQFGIDASLMADAVAQVENASHLELRGTHVYLGTRNLDVEAIAANTALAIATFEEVQALVGRPLPFADLGGGFGVPYYEGEVALDLDALGARLRGVLARARTRNPETTFAFELGRYVVAESGYCCLTVTQIKEAHGEAFAVCDGGSNVFATATASVMRRRFPIEALRARGQADRTYSVTGPLCTPTDVLVPKTVLPELSVGDVLVLPQAGAYGPSASAHGFLSFGHPAEVLIEDGCIRQIRARDSIERILAPQIQSPVLARLDACEDQEVAA